MVIGEPPHAIVVEIPDLTTDRTQDALAAGCEALAGNRPTVTNAEGGSTYVLNGVEYKAKTQGEALACAYLVVARDHFHKQTP